MSIMVICSKSRSPYLECDVLKGFACKYNDPIKEEMCQVGYWNFPGRVGLYSGVVKLSL